MKDVGTYHTSLLFLEYCVHKDPRLEALPGALLGAFAAVHGYEPEEMEEVFRAEELEHDARGCRLSGCVREWARKDRERPSKPHKIGQRKVSHVNPVSRCFPEKSTVGKRGGQQGNVFPTEPPLGALGNAFSVASDLFTEIEETGNGNGQGVSRPESST